MFTPLCFPDISVVRTPSGSDLALHLKKHIMIPAKTQSEKTTDQNLLNYKIIPDFIRLLLSLAKTNTYVCDTQVNTSKLSIIQQPFTEHRAEAFMALKEPYFPLDYASEASYFWYIYWENTNNHCMHVSFLRSSSYLTDYFLSLQKHFIVEFWLKNPTFISCSFRSRFLTFAIFRAQKYFVCLLCEKTF